MAGARRGEERNGCDGDGGARLLEVALLATFVAHGVAIALMGAVLARMLPGGPTHDEAARVALVAAHPWTYRVGWAAWQATAASDVLLAVALVRARFVPRAPAIAALLLTLAAVVPDQTAQALLVARGPALAASDPAAFLAFERDVFPWTAAWAACFYTATAVAWSWAFARAGTWSRALGWISAIAWTVFGVVSAGALLPVRWRLDAGVVAAGNAVGFVLLEIWLLLVAEQVHRRRRPIADHGALARWRHPARGIFARAADVVANSRVARAFGSLVPDLAFVSDVEDVVYVSYVVPHERLARFVPEGLELQRVGPGGAFALFTWLTYRHGHFAPRVVGPARRFAPSPIQSNWRVYVRDPASGREGIVFVTNAVSSTAYALAARVLADGMPMHVWRRAELVRERAALRLVLDAGEGTAPDAEARLAVDDGPDARTLPPSFARAFGSYEELLRACVPQDRAFSAQPWRGTMTRHEIHLGIPLEACVPLRGEVRSRAAAAIVGPDAEAVSFLVERVAFRLDATERDHLFAVIASRTRASGA